MGMIDVLDPTMEGPTIKRKMAPLVASIDGHNVGFRIFWNRFDIFMRRFEELLRERFQVGEIVKYYGHMGDLAGGKTDGVAEIMVGKHLEEHERQALVKTFYDRSRWAVIGLAA
ncbi:MAG: hypothetical protein ACKVQT_09985 [Burkholderiales bacterium]